jgi:hypothetical protein
MPTAPRHGGTKVQTGVSRINRSRSVNNLPKPYIGSIYLC